MELKDRGTRPIQQYFLSEFKFRPWQICKYLNSANFQLVAKTESLLLLVITFWQFLMDFKTLIYLYMYFIMCDNLSMWLVEPKNTRHVNG